MNESPETPVPPTEVRRDVLSRYRQAGRASAAAASPGHSETMTEDQTGAAFFDVDNTLMRGASSFHFAVGLARRNYFSGREIVGFGVKQRKPRSLLV